MLQKCTIWRVAGEFFREPSRTHYLKDLSRRTGIAHTAVANHLRTLQKEGIITKEVERRGIRRFPLYRATATERFHTLKRLHNRLAIEESGLLEHLRDTLAPGCIILFGSFERGEDTEDSDIDLYLQASQSMIDLTTFERKLGRRIQLHLHEEFRSYPAELKNNIINGTALAGYLEAFP